MTPQDIKKSIEQTNRYTILIKEYPLYQVFDRKTQEFVGTLQSADEAQRLADELNNN